MTPQPRWRHTALPLLLVVAALMFVLGVTLEPNKADHHDEPNVAIGEHAGEPETGETEQREGETGEARRSESAQTRESSEAERVLGLDLESPGLVALAVLSSFGLAALAWYRPRRPVLILIAAAAAGFAVLDIAEVTHQLNENRIGLASLAASVAALHALSVALAASNLGAAAS